MNKKSRWTLWISGLGLLVMGTVLLVQHGCTETRQLSPRLQPTEERSRRLTMLSAEEASLLPDADVRLTRQLNIADMQIARGWNKDAPRTLAEARKTLQSDDAKGLSDHARVSGWVSISELSRRVEDQPAASLAGERAVDAVLAISDEGKRCEYVIGVANELQFARGLSEAAGFVSQAGPWTKSLPDELTRRRAMVGFASVLFNLDDYAAGQTMLRQDPDVMWRTDTLARLAAMTEHRAEDMARLRPAAASAPMIKAENGAAEPTADQPYGKRLDYQSIFQNQKNSQTTRD